MTMHPDSLRPFVLAFLCHGLLLSVWAEPLKTRLTQSPHQLVYEAYIDDNWEIMTSHADGSQVRNLTRSKDRHELYPQVFPTEPSFALSPIKVPVAIPCAASTS